MAGLLPGTVGRIAVAHAFGGAEVGTVADMPPEDARDKATFDELIVAEPPPLAHRLLRQNSGTRAEELPRLTAGTRPHRFVRIDHDPRQERQRVVRLGSRGPLI
jgi:hypothetical protein